MISPVKSRRGPPADGVLTPDTFALLSLRTDLTSTLTHLRLRLFFSVATSTKHVETFDLDSALQL
jgi:hypothetical protein